MTDRLASTLSLSDKDALVYQNRSQEFNKDATTFAIDPLGKIAVICGYVLPYTFIYPLHCITAVMDPILFPRPSLKRIQV